MKKRLSSQQLFIVSLAIVTAIASAFYIFMYRQMKGYQMSNQSGPTLNYVLVDPRAPIVLNLFEAERYESAVVVQPLIGNLVYYSNKGRYEPKLAKSWSREGQLTWRFTLHQGLKCEDGELITATSFKDSIVRSLRYLTKKADFPVFNKLDGFQAFKQGADLTGIEAEGDDLVFHFSQPIRSGLLQLLSFAPFGYICSGNLNADGTWKDDHQFISSGPYRVESLEVGKKYVLRKNPNYILKYDLGAPEQVNIVHEVPQSVVDGENWIIDSFSKVEGLPQDFLEYHLVPEYINPILMGNTKSGYFADIDIRKNFKALLEKHRDHLPNHWGGHTRSQAFYPNQVAPKQNEDRAIGQLIPPQGPLIIGGSEPAKGSVKDQAWVVLKAALSEVGIKYQFADNKTNMAAITNQDFDLRLIGGSIGGGVEPWGISILFCSDLGPRFPDPSHRICEMVSKYEEDVINDEEFTNKFFAIVEDDAAIVPVSHYGIQLYIAGNLNRDSISPLMSVIRFEDLNF